jgi:hypothetical protein
MTYIIYDVLYYILDRGGYNTRGGNIALVANCTVAKIVIGNVIVIAAFVAVAVTMSSQAPHRPRRCVGRPPCVHPSYRDGTSATSFDRPSSAVSPWRPS